MEDSRLKGYFGTVTHVTQPFERTYCVYCGKPKGWVTTDTMNTIRAQQIIVICDYCEEANFPGGVPLLKANIQEF